jgi:hypothetical protein
MAIRARFDAPARTAPTPMPFLPAGFGQQTGMADLIQGIGKVARMLQQRRDEESDNRATLRSAELQVESVAEIERLNQTADPSSRIDEQFKQWFDGRWGELIDGAQTDRERRALESRLPGIWARMQVQAMGVETQRNHSAMIADIHALNDQNVNVLSTTSADPERDATGMRNEVGLMIARAGEREIFSPQEQESLLRESHETINSGMVLGLIRKDARSTLSRLQQGEWDTALNPGSKERLMNEAEKVIRQEDAELRQFRNSLIKRANDGLRSARSDIQSGYPPATFDLKAEIERIGGPEGAELMHELNLLETYGDNMATFAQQPRAIREAVLNQMAADRQAGRMSREQIDLHELLVDTNARINRRAREDAYSAAVESGVVDEPVELNPNTMEIRESQAQNIKAVLGRDAITLTSEEQISVTQNLLQGSPDEQLAALEMMAPFPLIADDVIRTLAKEGTPKHQHLTIALESIRAGDPLTSRRILVGSRLIDSGAPIPTTDTWIEAQNATVGQAFVGREHLLESYRNAATAYYIGNRGPGSFEVGADITPRNLRQAWEAVLPGQLVQDRYFTPSRDITPEMMNRKLESIFEREDWWRWAKWYNDTTDEFEPVTEAPSYLDGAKVPARDIFRTRPLIGPRSGLRPLSTGTYLLLAEGGFVTDGTRMLALDLREEDFSDVINRQPRLMIPGVQERP